MEHTVEQCKEKLLGIKIVLKQAESMCTGCDPIHRIQSAIQMVDELLMEGSKK